MATGTEQLSYWDAVKAIVLHPIDSLGSIANTTSGVSVPGSLSDAVSNAYVQLFTGQALTRSELEAIKTAAANDVLKAGGSIADAKAASQEIDSYYVNTYGEPDTSTGDVLNKILTVLTIAVIAGGVFFVYRIAKGITG